MKTGVNAGVVLAAFLTAVIPMLAAAAGTPAGSCLKPETDRPTIGLVLGGGGARGSAHIGVIRVLEELRIPVDCVAGTSIGSLVAALYATGMTADELEDVMLGMDWDDLFVDDTDREDQPYRRKKDDNLALFGPKLGIGEGAALLKPGVIAGQKVSFVFESLIKERVQTEDFDELPIPYRAIAADIVTSDKVVMSRGDLAVAMRASMSVPGVFDPVEVGDHLLVDGGIVDNVPVDVVRDMGADVLIVVDVGSGLSDRDGLTTSLDIIGQLVNMLVNTNSQQQLATLTDRDVLITPPLGKEVGSADFAKSAEGIRIGFQAADGQRAELAALSVPEAEYAAYKARQISRLQPDPVIRFVRLDNRSRFDDSVIWRHLNIEEGAPLDVEALDGDIRQIYALGFMKLVRYEVVQENGESGIIVHAGQDDRGTHLLEWGLDYYGGRDMSEVNVRLGYLNTAVDGYGSELRVITQVGQDPGLFAYLYKYLDPHLKIYLEPRLSLEQQVLTTYDEDGNALTRDEINQYGGAISLGREFGLVASAAVGVSRFTGDVKVRVGPPAQGGYDFDGGEVFGVYSLDRMDDRYFPRHGLYGRVYVASSQDWLGADAEYDQLETDVFGARTFGRHTLVGGFRYYETFSGEAPLYAQFRAGGFAHMSGYAHNELVGSNFSMVLGSYRYHFAGSGLLPAYAGFTVEYGGVAESAGDIYEDGLLNGSVFLGYRSPIGPLYIGLAAAEGGREQYFLRVGNIFGRSTIGR